YMCVFFFFFSSRRRHTRSKRDWSSDVCSSDLHLRVFSTVQHKQRSMVLALDFVIMSWATSFLRLFQHHRRACCYSFLLTNIPVRLKSFLEYSSLYILLL